jgi:hypothetical protein
VAVEVAVLVLVGVKVLVGVGVEEGENVGVIADGMKITSPARAASIITRLIILPSAVPTMEEKMEGIFNHNDRAGSILAVVDKAPMEGNTYFESPASFIAVMFICLKRSSRFKAIVFN